MLTDENDEKMAKLGGTCRRTGARSAGKENRRPGAEVNSKQIENFL